MRSQDRALHYSASRGKNWGVVLSSACLWWCAVKVGRSDCIELCLLKLQSVRHVWLTSVVQAVRGQQQSGHGSRRMRVTRHWTQNDQHTHTHTHTHTDSVMMDCNDTAAGHWPCNCQLLQSPLILSYSHPINYTVLRLSTKTSDHTLIF